MYLFYVIPLIGVLTLCVGCEYTMLLHTAGEQDSDVSLLHSSPNPSVMLVCEDADLVQFLAVGKCYVCLYTFHSSGQGMGCVTVLVRWIVQKFRLILSSTCVPDMYALYIM